MQHLNSQRGKQGEANSCRVKVVSFHLSSHCLSVNCIQLGDPPMSCTSGSNRTCSYTNALEHTHTHTQNLSQCPNPFVRTLARDDLKTEQKCRSCFLLYCSTFGHMFAISSYLLRWTCVSVWERVVCSDLHRQVISRPCRGYFWNIMEVWLPQWPLSLCTTTATVWTVEARRKVGQKSFLDKCLYIHTHTHKSVHLFRIHPSWIYPLQMVLTAFHMP